MDLNHVPRFWMWAAGYLRHRRLVDLPAGWGQSFITYLYELYLHVISLHIILHHGISLYIYMYIYISYAEYLSIVCAMNIQTLVCVRHHNKHKHKSMRVVGGPAEHV